MLQEVSKFAHRTRTFKARVTRPEGRHLLNALSLSLPPKIHDVVPMFIDIEDCLRFAPVETDLMCGRDQDIDAPDVGSFSEAGRENLPMHSRSQPVLGGVQAQFVSLPAPGNESRKIHLDFCLPRQGPHRLSVRLPIRVHAVDELLCHRAYFERVERGFDSNGKELTQLPVHQIRSRIDIVEIEDKGGRGVHSEKLRSTLALINLVESLWSLVAETLLARLCQKGDQKGERAALG